MSGIRSQLAILAAALMLLPGATVSAPDVATVQVPTGIVDCLLPGAMRRIGGAYYQMPGRPARITATECGIRGGDYLLYDRANYETSLKYWITEAERAPKEKDRTNAMIFVGKIYEEGIGREPDYSSAASWYQKAADAGSTTAMISLAHLYKTGKGVSLNLATAQALYSKAFGSGIQIPLDPTSVAGADQRVETLIAEVDEVRRQKIAVELELQAASEQLADARESLDDALSGNGENAELIRDLRAAIAIQQSEISGQESHLDAIRAENAELQLLRQQLEEQKLETAKLRNILATAETKVADHQGQLDRQQEALDAKQSEFDDQLASASIDAVALQSISRELEQYREALKTLEASLRNAEEERSLFKALASDTATKEERVATLTARITLLEQQSSNAQGDFETLRIKLVAAQSKLDAQVTIATEAAQLSETEIAARNVEIGRLRGAVARAETETKRHRADIDHLGQQSVELEQLRADFEREQAQSNRLQQLLTESQDRFVESNARVAEVNASHELLVEEIEALREGATAGDQASQALLLQREGELQGAKDELANLQGRIVASEAEFDRYQQQMTGTAKRQRQAIEDLRVAVGAARAKRTQLEDKLASASHQLTSAQTDLELEQQRHTELQDDFREALAQNTASSEALAEKQTMLDDQNQQVGSLQREIERLLEQTSRYEATISDLEARAQSEPIEFVGPRIVMLEPSESLLANAAPPIGENTQTRGIAVVAASHQNETKIIRGRVEAPAGLAELTIDGWDVSFDENNSFTRSLKLDSEAKDIRIVAIDHNGNRDVKEFRYRVGGSVVRGPGGLPGIYNSKDRFPRNDALDHLRYYALIIANEDYDNDFAADLKTPIADAEAIGKILETRYNFQVEILRNADRRTIGAVLERIFYHEENDDNEENDKDAILIYYAGHGTVADSRANNRYYWIPVDGEYDSPETWFETRKIEDYLEYSAVNQIMVIADSCFAGNVLSRDGIAGEFASLKSRNWKKFLTEYTERKKSRYVMTSGGFAPVLDGGGGDHSVFARAFIDVLLANNEIISASNLHERIAPIVLSLAESQDFKQTPLFGYLRSAGHEFGNFYLPAPQYSAQTTMSIDSSATR